MTIAVIIPTLNEEQALPATLHALIPMGFDEILVVDGGSSDRTRDMAFSFIPEPRAAILGGSVEGEAQRAPLRVITATRGRASQMNAGAAASLADVYLFLHADTLLPEGARELIEQALADPTCVGGRFDVRFERDTGLPWLIARLISLRSRWSGIATGDQALFIRRAVFVSLGGFAEIPLMEDVEFCRRLKRVGRLSALRACVVTSYRRWERCGALRTIVLMWTLRFLYWLGVQPDRLHRWYADVR
jgi:rSAM/selenodomain-associated transferase 2